MRFTGMLIPGIEQFILNKIENKLNNVAFVTYFS